MNQNFIVKYFSDSWQEFGRVTWPTRNRAVNLCILVITFVIIVAAVIAGIDFVFNTGYSYLLGLAPSSNSL